jgi:hypothetical protein
MQHENQEERRGYMSGYEAGKRGLGAYNDTYINVTGSLIVWRLNSSHYAESYSQGFRDGLENPRRPAPKGTVAVVLFSVGSFVATIIALWR